MAAQLKEIEADFANFFISRIYSGRVSAKVREQMTPIIQSGIQQFVRDQVNERLQRALLNGEHPQSVLATGATPMVAEAVVAQVDSESMPIDDAVETTEDEIQGHLIIRAMLGDIVDLNRVAMRDAKSYCAIILDDNNRQPIARLWFNRSQWYLGTFDENKKETRNPIASLTEIYDYREALREATRRYL